MVKYISIFLFILFGFLILNNFLCLPTDKVFASTTDGTVSGYAWSENIGWINFGATNSNAHITDSVLTGNAWNENKGWIKLDPTNSGVKNNGSGNLSGSAWGEGVGWINFSGVIINSSGRFTGTATGDNTGHINFDCDHCSVQTDWRPQSARVVISSGGGGGGSLPPEAYNLPKPPFSVLINDGLGYTNNPAVVLKFQAGQDAKSISVSNSPGFESAVLENYVPEKKWTLANGDGQKTVYVKFYTKYGQASQIFFSTIILDTKIPEIAITGVKNQYSSDEEVILSGTTKSNAEVVALIDDSYYGVFNADDKGNWLVTFGKMAKGNHHLEIYAKDLAGNQSKTISIDFLIVKSGVAAGPNLGSAFGPILKQLENGIAPLIPKIFIKEELKPVKVVTVPKLSPLAFKGKWNYLPVKAINAFVLAPLPKDIAVLSQKIPQVGKTFSQVGVSKVTDVLKIKASNFKLPGLTETIGLVQPQITAGKFAPPKGIPIEKLSAAAKMKIPSEIVFAKTGAGLVDYKIALSINDKGNSQQTIKTISGKPLQLVVRVDSPAKKVIGYIIFKSKNASQAAFNVPLNDMTASLSFATPDFTNAFNPVRNILASVEGMPSLEANTIIKSKNNGINSQGQQNQMQKKLVLAQFEYQYTGNGVYTATVQAPVVAGEYDIMTIVDYQDPALLPKQMDLITVVDPEGYVYQKNGDLETRIVGAVVSLYWLNPQTKQYQLWSAKDYQQENPQVTDVSGTYSFLVPDGYYYLKVDTPGYLSYDGKPFQVTEGSGIHINIELKSRYWFLNIVDWKTLLLVIVILMLLYNFYKDKVREKMAMLKQTK